MPRNSSGTYSLYTPGNPVTTGTVITTTWANNTLSDLATALTDSLSRSGDGGMLAALELAAGVIGTPGLSWTAEPTSGLYRAGSGNFRYAIGGADVITLTSSGLSVTGALSTATLSSSGAAALNSLLVGAATGGNQGAGTVNATAVYDDGVQITNQTGADPTATVGLSAVNGSAGTFMRSDAAPALSQAIAPTWTGQHAWALALRGPNGSAATPTYTFSGDLDTGVFLGAADILSLAAGGSNRLNISTSSIRPFLPVLAIDGSAAAPTYTFDNDPDTGIYRAGANALNIVTGGASRMQVANGYVLIESSPLLLQDGSAAAPSLSFQTDQDTGLYRSGANILALAAAGGTPVVVRGDLANGQLGVVDGSATVPSVGFQNDSDTGIYRGGANDLRIVAGGTFIAGFQLDGSSRPLAFFADGVAAAPSITFGSDPDTGFYRITTNSLGVATGGTVRVTVTNGVQVGAPTGGDQGAGTINATAVYDDGLQIFPNIPRSTTSTTLVAADQGKCVAVTTNIAIPASVFNAGDAVSIYNDSGSSISITIAAGTLRLGGTATTGTRTLAQRGIATLWFNVGGATPDVVCTGNVT